MIVNKKHAGRNLCGEGPAVFNVTGGRGRRPTSEGAAMEWALSEALTSLQRLRIVSLLCHEPGLRVPVIAGILEIHQVTIYQALWGMRDLRIVRCAPTSHHPYRAGSGKLAMDWNVTEDGRKWLWRFGYVTARLRRYRWWYPALGDDTEVSPWEALRLWGLDWLCRPAALATAYHFMDRGPTCRNAAVTRLDLYASAWHIRKWKQAGLLVEAPKPTPRRYERVNERSVPLKFTMEAHRAIGGHVDALVYAARHSGYEGDNWYREYLEALHPDGDIWPPP